MEIKEGQMPAILTAAFCISSLLFMNLLLSSIYAITVTRVSISTAYSNPFVFVLSATSTSTSISGSGIGIVMKNNCCLPPVRFTYSIDSLAVSQTINGVNGKVGNTVYLTATVTESTNTMGRHSVPIGSKFFITGNDPCCGFDPSSHLANSPVIVIVSFQGPLGGVYTAGVVNILQSR